MMIVALALLVFKALQISGLFWIYIFLTVPSPGQPYAFRQAGLTMAIVLLVALTITVGFSATMSIVRCSITLTNEARLTGLYS